MMVICIKQHLSNIWSLIHEKVKQNWGWIEKKRCLLKKRVFVQFEKRESRPQITESNTLTDFCVF